MPDADVRRAAAAELPWIDATFDLVVSQLVLNFLPDAEAGVAEMLRVIRPGGTIAACTWDYADGMTMLRTFWDAARDVDPDVTGRGAHHAVHDRTRARRAVGGRRADGHTDQVARGEHHVCGLRRLLAAVHCSASGPAGAYVASLDAERLAQLRAGCFERLGRPRDSFTLSARAVAVSGRRAD